MRTLFVKECGRIEWDLLPHCKLHLTQLIAGNPGISTYQLMECTLYNRSTVALAISELLQDQILVLIR